ncbi:hypothetical protein [Aliivibrio fischeri]|uniref:hypothetical protein n=1 Tax=Aliivibrio fischeri TaxID=668 RepID=UPI00080E35BD|nr:hypothetical protein [Aliivibrio fischeri]OCH29982.1 hypothetical protein A6D99_04280 [Aliivibrio fischeri]
MSEKKVSSYLDSGRLGEVLALIQVLAYDKKTSRSEKGLQNELKSKPTSDKSWIQLANNHPEFFRVRIEGGKVDRASLVSRFVLPHTLENGNKIRPQLDPSIVNKLMEVAIDLHDRQVTRSTRWHIWIPVVVSVIAASAAITAAIIRVSA